MQIILDKPINFLSGNAIAIGRIDFTPSCDMIVDHYHMTVVDNLEVNNLFLLDMADQRHVELLRVHRSVNQQRSQGRRCSDNDVRTCGHQLTRTNPTPPGWAADELTKFLQDAHQQQYATFHNKKEAVGRLVSVDELFVRV